MSPTHTRHHRKPKSRGGSGKRHNIVLVPDNLHKAYHVLFRNLTPHQVAKILTETWVDPEWELIARRKK